MKNIIKNSFFIQYLATFCSTTISYFFFILLGKYLGPYKYSEISYLIFLSSLFITLCDFGTDNSFAYIKKEFTNFSVSDLQTFIFSFKFILLILSIPLFIFTNYFFNFSENLYFLLLTFPLFYPFQYLEYKNKAHLISIFVLLEKIIFIIFFVILISIFNINPLIYCISYFLSSIIIISTSLSNIKFFKIFNLDYLLQNIKNYKYLFTKIWPIFSALLIQLTYGIFSRIYVVNKLNNEDFSFISVCFQAISFIGILQIQAERKFRPQIIKFNINSINRLFLYLRKFRGYLNTTVLINFVIFVILIPSSNTLIKLTYGEAWLELKDSIILIPLFAILFSVIRLFELINISNNKSNYNLLVLTISTVIFILFLLIFNPQNVKMVILTLIISMLFQLLLLISVFIRKTGYMFR